MDRGDLRLNPSSRPAQVQHYSVAPFLIMEGIQKNPQWIKFALKDFCQKTSRLPDHAKESHFHQNFITLNL